MNPLITFKALASDFDGTLASEDRVDSDVKGALEQARRLGVRLILVTGRTFFELTRVCDCLELFDAVVAVCVFARTTNNEELAQQAMLSGHRDAGRVSGTLPHLRRGEFRLVDRDPGSGRRATTFIAAPRRTVHVRHLSKYVDSVVAPGREFLFRSSQGRVLASANSRGDFSRWVRDVFGDTELARQIGEAEVRFQRGELADLRQMIDILITARYGGGS
ncbi:MAG TPA: HAD hydrolase family protein [Verrucomicrobiae bacterium]|nr:HAD hydrolase family protein [Verrucomicrobiae bacterium]